jgi:endonuclease/exonuclease/phosphatase (EEP) superfamily protein YafD
VRILERGGILLPSTEEPTGIARATITFQGALLRVHGIWLGLSPEERERQLTAALDYIGPGPATLAGDMNATPDSPTYARMLAEGFTDPFVAGAFDPAPTSPAINPRERIDYVWVRGLDPVDARVLPSLASDHRMVVVEVD